MKQKRFVKILLIFLIIVFLISCKNNKVKNDFIKDIKMAHSIDNNLNPVGVASTFNSNVSLIYNWFYYEDAPENILLDVVWYYNNSEKITEYKVNISDKGIRYDSLRIPSNVNFPAGMYLIKINLKNKTIKNISFEVI